MNEQRIVIALELVVHDQKPRDFTNISMLIVECMQDVEKLKVLQLTGEEKKEVVIRLLKHLAIKHNKWTPSMDLFVPLFIETVILLDKSEIRINLKKQPLCRGFFCW